MRTARCVLLVHREPLAPVIEGAPEPLELAGDHRAGLATPLPHPLHEGLTAEVVAGHPLVAQQPLDHVLHPDARVIGAVDPERVAPLHAAKSDERVLDRAVQRMAHVQRARDVRGRHRDRVRLAGVVRLRLEGASVEPALQDRGFDGACVVARAVGELGAARVFHGVKYRGS